MIVEGLRYVMLGCSDLDASVAFYRDTLGLVLISRFEDFAFFETGEAKLALSGELGRAEFVLGAKSVVEAHRVLSGRGVKFINEPRQVNEANWAANFRDPGGHLLSIYGAS
jgi:catechol 2,3-dioxygenase-like lactoylglutathione lyase family enzyme